MDRHEGNTKRENGRGVTWCSAYFDWMINRVKEETQMKNPNGHVWISFDYLLRLFASDNQAWWQFRGEHSSWIDEAMNETVTIEHPRKRPWLAEIVRRQFHCALMDLRPRSFQPITFFFLSFFLSWFYFSPLFC